MEKKRIRDILSHNNDGSIAWDHADCLKHMQEGFDRQGQWFVEEMMPLLEAHRTTVYIMPGNSDWKHHFQPRGTLDKLCLLYTSPSPRDLSTSRMPSSA